MKDESLINNYRYSHINIICQRSMPFVSFFCVPLRFFVIVVLIPKYTACSLSSEYTAFLLSSSLMCCDRDCAWAFYYTRFEPTWSLLYNWSWFFFVRGSYVWKCYRSTHTSTHTLAHTHADTLVWRSHFKTTYTYIPSTQCAQARTIENDLASECLSLLLWGSIWIS